MSSEKLKIYAFSRVSTPQQIINIQNQTIIRKNDVILIGYYNPYFVWNFLCLVVKKKCLNNILKIIIQ